MQKEKNKTNGEGYVSFHLDDAVSMSDVFPFTQPTTVEQRRHTNSLQTPDLKDASRSSSSGVS